ncbi:MAG: T9SS type A sorting domain-containing protein, partial [Candidatus Coatesbacteria bacterium]|nr:T9SS type A sorting domain-containing protein [Candidatus Coatesbacteria bacterium]
GQEIWKVPLSGETRNGVTIANNSIYYIDNGNFICRDFSSNEKWRYDGVGNNHRQAISAIQINGDIIVPGSQWLFCFSPEGSLKFRITMANFNTIITDKNSNIFAYLHAYGLYDLACYNSQGDTLWTRILDNYTSGFEMCLNVNGDIVLGYHSIIYCYSTKTGFSSSTSSSYLPSQSLSASPNPFSTRLSVSLSSSGAIYSLIGQLIMKLDKGKHSVDTSKWREGVYIIKSGKECKRVAKVRK